MTSNLRFQRSISHLFHISILGHRLNPTPLVMNVGLSPSSTFVTSQTYYVQHYVGYQTHRNLTRSSSMALNEEWHLSIDIKRNSGVLLDESRCRQFHICHHRPLLCKVALFQLYRNARTSIELRPEW